jgi:cell division protein FtsW (lipid II flippase)
MFEIVMLVYIVPSYTVLFVSSLSIYFDETNSKEYHFFIPIFVYCAIIIIIIIELFYFKMKEAFSFIYLPIFVAFFPLYSLKYYRKYIKGENS